MTTTAFRTITQPVEDSRRPLPWDAMGTDLTAHDFDTVADALAATGLDYTVQKAADQAVMDDGTIVPAHNRIALVRPAPKGGSGWLNLGVTGKGYGLIQNQDAFAVFDELKQNHGLVIETAAEFRHGGAALLIARMPRPVILHRGGVSDEVTMYAYGRNGFAGASTIHFDVTALRIGCTNALPGLSGAAHQSFTVRHTTNAATRLEVQADRLIAYLSTLVDTTDVALQAMVDAEVGTAAVDAFLADMFPVTPKLKDNDRHINGINARRATVRTLMESPNLAGFHGTAYAMLNGVTDYVDHYRPVKGKDTEVALAEGALEGWGADLKARAYNLALAAIN